MAPREITVEEGKRTAAELKIEHFEMSAKTGQNVEELFFHIIDVLSEAKSPGQPATTASMMRQIKEERKEEDA